MHSSSQHTVVRLARRRRLLGRCLNDRYSVTAVIAEGASSIVYAAEDRRTGSEVVIKAADGPRALEAVHRERLAARVVHPFVCAVRDWGDVDGTPCTVLERVLGDTLEVRLTQGPIAPDKAVGIVIAIATALDVMHEGGLVHRNLKPANVVLVRCAGRRPVVKLIDFSLVQEQTEQAYSEPLSSPAYMSPEQVRGGPVTPASDTFAAGIVLFELVTGHHPFASATGRGALLAAIHQNPIPSVIRSRHDLPPLLDDIIAQATRKNPRERYRSAGAMAMELEVVLADLRRR